MQAMLEAKQKYSMQGPVQIVHNYVSPENQVGGNSLRIFGDAAN